MRRFDYTFLRSGMLPTCIFNIVGPIYSLKTMSEVRKEKHLEIFEELGKIAKVQSVKSLNSIEGNVTSDSRIAAIVNESATPLNHDEKEIAGYRDALNEILSHYNQLDFTAKDILSLHKTMLDASGADFGGKYKTCNNAIVGIDELGKRRVRFAPVSVAETPAAMEQLCLAYLDARNDSEINQLLLIPCVILDFLCIRPFRDGNRRMSMLLSMLLLCREGFDVVKYVSFEERINQHKTRYNEALEKSSANWHVNRNDYSLFIENFLFALYMCYKEVDKKFAVVGDVKFNKSNRVEAVLLGSLSPISKREIHNILPDISIGTIENVLARMLREGKITKMGTTRMARYIRS